MFSITAKTKHRVFGTSDAWSLFPDSYAASMDCEVVLEIQGSGGEGCTLVICPSGFFTADYWFESRRAAMNAAKETFEVGDDEWIDTLPDHKQV